MGLYVRPFLIIASYTFSHTSSSSREGTRFCLWKVQTYGVGCTEGDLPAPVPVKGFQRVLKSFKISNSRKFQKKIQKFWNFIKKSESTFFIIHLENSCFHWGACIMYLSFRNKVIFFRDPGKYLIRNKKNKKLFSKYSAAGIKRQYLIRKKKNFQLPFFCSSDWGTLFN